MTNKEWKDKVLMKIGVDGLSPKAEGQLLVLLSREFEEPTDDYEDLWTEIFGERAECPSCGTLVLPDFLCWGCEEWVAVSLQQKED